jgi:hypothetical protein
MNGMRASSGASRKSVGYGSSSGGDRDPETAPASAGSAVLPGARPRPEFPDLIAVGRGHGEIEGESVPNAV